MSCWSRLNVKRPSGKTVFTEEEAKSRRLMSWDILCWCGPPMCWAARAWKLPMTMANIRGVHVRSSTDVEQEHPILVDKYMMGKEIEVDAVSDGEDVSDPGDHGARGASRRPLGRQHFRVSPAIHVSRPAQGGDHQT